MNKLKTLLIVSAISISTSACAGHFHAKNDGAAPAGMNCKSTKNMERAQKDAEKVLKSLDEAAANTTDAATKKRLAKIIKEADKLANDIGKCKKMCDAKVEGDKAPAKAKHKKEKAAVKAPAAVPAAAAPAAAK